MKTETNLVCCVAPSLTEYWHDNDNCLNINCAVVECMNCGSYLADQCGQTEKYL